MPVKVLHILNQLALAGTEKKVITLFKEINSRDFDLSLFCFNPRAVDSGILPDNIDYYEYHRKEGLDLKIVARIVKIVKRKSINIIHSHNWGTLFYAVLAARISGCVHIHGEHGKEVFSDLSENTWKRQMVKRASAVLTDFFITVSEDLKNELVDIWRVNEKKIKVIPNGVDTIRFRPDPVLREQIRNELNINDNMILIGVVGWLRPIKNQRAAINIMPALLNQYKNIKLVLVGDGSEKSYLKKLSHEIGVSSSIVFLGHRNDIPSVMNAFDIYIQPSLFEGMSNTIMGAMAVALPVIAMDVGGNDELVENEKTGYLIPPDQFESKVLKERIEKLVLNENKRRKMGETARIKMVTHFTVKNMIKSNEELYKRFGGNV